MRSKRRTVLWIVLGLLSIVLALFIAFNAHLRYTGWPKIISTKICDKLNSRGIAADIGHIQGDLFSPVSLQHITLKDQTYSQWVLASVDTLTLNIPPASLLLGAKPNQVEITVGNARIRLPLVDPGNGNNGKTLLIDNIDGKVELLKKGYARIKINGKLDDLPITLSGVLALPQKKKTADKGKGLTIAPWLPRLAEKLRPVRILCQTLKQSEKAKLDLQVDWPGGYTRCPRFQAQLQVRNLLTHGVMINRFTGNLNRPPDGRLQATLSAQINEQERLQAELEMDSAQSCSGTLSGTLYPRRILVLAGKPWADFTRQLYCKGNPPSFSLHLHPSPFKQPEKWRTDFTVDATDVRFRKYDLSRLRANGKWQNGILSLGNATLAAKPDISARLNGEWTPRTADSWLHGIIEGMPDFVAMFFHSAKGKKVFRRELGRFTWAGNARPNGVIDLLTFRDRIGKVRAVVDGTIYSGRTRYNGIQVAQASTHLLIASAEHLLMLSDVNLYANGNGGAAELVWDFAKKEMRFSVDSHLRPDVLLGLIRKKWRTLPARLGLHFNGISHARGSGMLSLKSPHHLTLSGVVAATQIRGRKLEINKARTRLSYSGDAREWRAQNFQADSLKLRGWSMQAVKAADIRLTPVADHGVKTKSTGVTVRRCQGYGWDAAKLRGSVITTPKDVQADATAEQASWHDWDFSGITTTARFADNCLKASSTAKRLVGNGWTLHQTKLDWTLGAKIFTFAGSTAKTECPDLATAENLHFAGKYADNLLKGSGTIGTFSAIPGQLRSNNLVLSFQQQKKTTSIQFTGDAARLFDSVQTQAFQGEIALTGKGCFQGNTQITHFQQPGRLRGDKLTLQFSRHGEMDAIALNGKIDQLSGPDWMLRDCTARGRNRADFSAFALTASAGTYHKIPMSKITTRLTRDNDYLSLREIKSTCLNGKINGDFFINLPTRTGKFRLFTDKIEIAPLLKILTPNWKKKTSGQLTSSFNLAFQPGPKRLALTGSGRLRIHDGKLWTVPFIGDFLDLLNRIIPAGDLAKITALDSDLRFTPKFIQLVKLQTNGSLVAVSADGYYNWDPGSLDFYLRAEPLRNFFSSWKLLSIIPDLVTRPLSVLLERRLIGTLDKPKWEDITVIRNLFRRKKKSAPPHSLINKEKTP